MGSDEHTLGSLFSGELECLQHRDGYRFSVDAILLAHFFTPARGERILDLGAGCGIIALIVAYRWPDVEIMGLEVQPSQAALAQRNLALNNFTGRATVVCGDLHQIGQFVPVGSFDWVLSNPPYRKMASGRRNQEEEQTLSRHEVKADLAAVLKAANFALKTKGRLVLVYPASRGAHLLYELKKNGLEPKRLQVVHSYPGDEARLFLVEALKGGGEELRVLPPFFIYNAKGGAYSAEMARCYEAGAISP